MMVAGEGRNGRGVVTNKECREYEKRFDFRFLCHGLNMLED